MGAYEKQELKDWKKTIKSNIKLLKKKLKQVNTALKNTT